MRFLNLAALGSKRPESGLDIKSKHNELKPNNNSWVYIVTTKSSNTCNERYLFYYFSPRYKLWLDINLKRDRQKQEVLVL